MSTALVTGASDGIGLEFCRILADRGYDLILVARRKDKLNDIGKSLTAAKGITCTVISADLSKPQAAQKLFQATQKKNLQVDLLINNAGLLHNGLFTELDLGAQENMIRVNMLALTSLTHLFANDMAGRGGGHILNLASLAAWTPIPSQNVYAATKAYVLSFTQALHNELTGSWHWRCSHCSVPGIYSDQDDGQPGSRGQINDPRWPDAICRGSCQTGH